MRIGIAVVIETANDDLVHSRLEYLPLELVDSLVLEYGLLEFLPLPLPPHLGLFSLPVLVAVKLTFRHLYFFRYRGVFLLIVLFGDDPTHPRFNDIVLLLLEV